MTTTARAAPGALRALLAESIDYAGLFPPARLDMAEAVAEYAKGRNGDHAWMLARFVLPVARLSEWEAAAGTHPADGGEWWRLSALGGPELAEDVKAIEAFNRRHQGLARVDSVELRAASVQEIGAAINLLPPKLVVHFEIPTEPDPEPLLRTIAARGACAKVRTGGLTPDAFPTPESLARFIQLCTAARVPFKATAGLHHPLRGEYRLTYEPGSPSGTMFGFLNVFLAAALLRAGHSVAEALALLEEPSAEAFQWNDQGVIWRGRRLDRQLLRDTRRECALSFGSCSMAEPIRELQAMGIL